MNLTRRAKTVLPVPPQTATPAAPAITQTVGVRGLLTPRALRRGKVNNPTPAQQTPNPNPPITQLVGVRGRLSARALRRGQVDKPIPAQVNPPIDPNVTKVRRWAAVRPRPGTAEQPVPAQQQLVPNPKITQTVSVRGRLTPRALRRGQADTPVAAQEILAPGVGKARRPVVFWRGNRSPAELPVPAQQSTVQNPKITQTTDVRGRLTPRALRRGQAQVPVRAQVNPPFVSQAGRGRPVRGRSRPSWHSPTPVPPQDGTAASTVYRREKLRRVVAFVIPRRFGKVFDKITTLGGPIQVTDSHGVVTSTENSAPIVGSVGGVGSVANVQGSASSVTTNQSKPTVTGTEGSSDQVQQ